MERAEDGKGDLKAAACSLLLPGLGQWLQGRRTLALAMLAAAVVLWCFWLGWMIHLWSVLDADLHVAGD